MSILFFFTRKAKRHFFKFAVFAKGTRRFNVCPVGLILPGFMPGRGLYENLLSGMRKICFPKRKSAISQFIASQYIRVFPLSCQLWKFSACSISFLSFSAGSGTLHQIFIYTPPKKYSPISCTGR